MKSTLFASLAQKGMKVRYSNGTIAGIGTVTQVIPGASHSDNRVFVITDTATKEEHHLVHAQFRRLKPRRNR